MNHSKYILKLIQIWKLSFPKKLNSFKIISESCRVSVDDALTLEFSAGDDGGLVINTKQKKLKAKILFFKTKITS